MDEHMADNYLNRLRRAPPLGLLDDLDDRVMAALVLRKREANGAQWMMALAAFISLGSGAYAGISMTQNAGVERALSPFAPVNALAPSTLLETR